MLSDFFTAVVNFLLPQVCVLCQEKSHERLCANCKKILPKINCCCKRCGRELPQPAEICGTCLRETPPFSRTVAPFHYAAPMDRFIIALKFNRQLIYAKLLGDLLAEDLIKYYEKNPKPAVIIPVPLHAERLCERGYNQALEIAKPIAKALKIPVERYSCKRIKNTAAQTGLSAKERRQNVKQAFAVNHKISEHVAVIDDVITTGSTITEFCKVLRQAGANKIDVWCCVRSGKNGNSR